jgi:hypothetical protein
VLNWNWKYVVRLLNFSCLISRGKWTPNFIKELEIWETQALDFILTIIGGGISSKILYIAIAYVSNLVSWGFTMSWDFGFCFLFRFFRLGKTQSIKTLLHSFHELNHFLCCDIPYLLWHAYILIVDTWIFSISWPV